MNEQEQYFEIPRPPGHEKVSADLLIYALPGWEGESTNATAESRRSVHAEEGARSVGMVALVATLVSAVFWGMLSATEAAAKDHFETPSRDSCDSPAK